jgi:hypothetical protein
MTTSALNLYLPVSGGTSVSMDNSVFTGSPEFYYDNPIVI